MINPSVTTLTINQLGHSVRKLGNTKADLFVRPELARAVPKSEGFVFPVQTE